MTSNIRTITIMMKITTSLLPKMLILQLHSDTRPLLLQEAKTLNRHTHNLLKPSLNTLNQTPNPKPQPLTEAQGNQSSTNPQTTPHFHLPNLLPHRYLLATRDQFQTTPNIRPKKIRTLPTHTQRPPSSLLLQQATINPLTVIRRPHLVVHLMATTPPRLSQRTGQPQHISLQTTQIPSEALPLPMEKLDSLMGKGTKKSERQSVLSMNMDSPSRRR